MINLEGIKLSEIKESELEKKSIAVNDDYNFDDCALTKKERLEKIKQELINLNVQQQNPYNNDDVDDYEDCRKK